MIQSHDHHAIDHMKGGVTQAIYLNRIPFTVRFFSVRSLPASPADFAGRAESHQRPFFIVPVFVLLIFCGWHIKNATGHSPVIATVAFLNLAFLRTHPRTGVHAMRANSMIQYTAITSPVFKCRDLVFTPFELQGEMIVFVFLLCRKATINFSRHAQGRSPISIHHRKYVRGVIVETGRRHTV